jgi:hypothetical protein
MFSGRSISISFCGENVVGDFRWIITYFLDAFDKFDLIDPFDTFEPSGSGVGFPRK